MAYAEKRKDGYRLRASCGYDASGKQITLSKSWRPEPGWSAKRTEKELQTALVRFQEECDSCSISGNIKFSVFAAQWLKEYAEKTMKKSSIERMRKYAPRADAALGHLSMDKITTRHMQRFVNNLGEDGVNKTTGGGLKPKTIKNYLSYVSSVFQYAVRMGMLKQNPCKNVVLPKPDAAEREVMTLEQAQAFVDSLDAAPLQWKAFCVLAIYSGLRRGELLGLEWPDIDFDNRIITVCRESQYNPTDGLYTDTPKTASSRRTLKLPQVVFDVLRAYRADQNATRLSYGDQWHDSGRLFTGEDGKPMHPNTPYTWLKRFCERTDQPFYGVHHFRHLNATLQIVSGADARTVSANLGHSKTSTTLNLYAHTFDDARARASDGVGDLLAARKQTAKRA